MTTRILLTYMVVFALPLLLTSQSSYKLGYIIDNTGSKREVEIRERNWSRNPSSIEYRSGNSGAIQLAEIADLREFGITRDAQLFVRGKVEIEQSPDNIAQLSSSSVPVFSTEIVWLRQLVAGDADLYYWSGNRLQRYFYRLRDGEILPLLHRTFKFNGNQVRQDNQFRATLASFMNCAGGTELPDPKSLEYDKEDLLEYVSTYNFCRTGTQRVFSESDRSSITFALRLGVDGHTFNFSSFAAARFGDRILLFPTLGFEVEEVLDFTNRKWALFMGANYRSVHHSAKVKSVDYTLEYQSIEVALGTRYGILTIGKKSFYAVVAGIADIPFSDPTFERRGRRLKVGLSFGATAGLGFRFNQHFEAEARYRMRQQLLVNYTDANLYNQGFQLTLAYRL